MHAQKAVVALFKHINHIINLLVLHVFGRFRFIFLFVGRNETKSLTNALSPVVGYALCPVFLRQVAQIVVNKLRSHFHILQQMVSANGTTNVVSAIIYRATRIQRE